LIIGYGNNLPVLAKELRRSMEEFTGSTAGLNRIDEVFVDGDFAAVKAASVEKVDGCLVLFFSHTPDGWRNYSLRNAPLNASLRELLAASVKSLNVPLQKRAKAFVDLLAKGQFAGATADFDDAMRTAMPEAKLAELWQQLNSAGGKFLGIGPVVRVEQVPEYFCVYVPCRWERNRVDLKIVFNSAGKLSGLWIVKPADQ